MICSAKQRVLVGQKISKRAPVIRRHIVVLQQFTPKLPQTVYKIGSLSLELNPDISRLFLTKEKKK